MQRHSRGTFTGLQRGAGNEACYFVYLTAFLTTFLIVPSPYHRLSVNIDDETDHMKSRE